MSVPSYRRAIPARIGGLAPQGDKYDDPSEYGNPYDYIQDKGWWKAISEGGYF